MFHISWSIDTLPLGQHFIDENSKREENLLTSLYLFVPICMPLNNLAQTEPNDSSLIISYLSNSPEYYLHLEISRDPRNQRL